MVILGGWVFLMSEVPLYVGQGWCASETTPCLVEVSLQGYLAHKKQRTPRILQ